MPPVKAGRVRRGGGGGLGFSVYGLGFRVKGFRV